MSALLCRRRINFKIYFKKNLLSLKFHLFQFFSKCILLRKRQKAFKTILSIIFLLFLPFLLPNVICLVSYYLFFAINYFILFVWFFESLREIE